MVPRCWPAFWLFFLGCHSLAGPDRTLPGDPAQQNQAADPPSNSNHLRLAAAHLETGNFQKACQSLAEHLEARPKDLEIRVQYAELLFRLQGFLQARGEFERFISEAQEKEKDLLAQLIHSHSRLMDIADGLDNAYEVHLNRGIGLFLLARRRTALGEPEGELPSEGLLVKAAGELSLAQQIRPLEARPCWYLHSTWRQLGQQQPARRWLLAAVEKAPFSSLTPTEQRALYLASQPDPKK